MKAYWGQKIYNEAKAEARQCEVEMKLTNSCEAEAKNHEAEAENEAKCESMNLN